MAHERRSIRQSIEAFLKGLGGTASEIKVFMVLSKERRYMTTKELEEVTGLSYKSVRTALKKLENKGLVKVKEKEGKRLYKAVSAAEVVEKWKERVESLFSQLFKRP